MDRRERRSTVYVDLEAARSAIDQAGQTPAAFVGRLVALAKGSGRVLSARAYGDVDGDEAREIKRAGGDVVLTTEDGEGSAPESIALALDAVEALVSGPTVDLVVLATDDAGLAELVRRLKRGGRTVVVVAPAAFAGSEPGRSADRALTIEGVLAGEVETEAAPAETRPSSRSEARARPSQPTLDLESYDWTKLVLLMRDLEAKMPFVGMRWLKNKVIGPHNVGAVTLADKQLLLNRAVDDGILETYRVGNRDEAGEPVTACRLLRESEKVKTILAANPAPAAPVAETAPS